MKQKIGILGGGQLGKMLCLAAGNWHLETFVLDKKGCSAENYCAHFIEGDFKNYDDVLNFGRLVDIITIEIEHVNMGALKQLEHEGKQVYPSSKSLSIIADKNWQKIFYFQNELPSSRYVHYPSKKKLLFTLKENHQFPCVWKSCEGGYDGKGVAVLKSPADANDLPDVRCIVEEMVDIDKEICVMAARSMSGEIAIYPPVEMVFEDKANLLDYQICPSNLSKKQITAAKKMAKKLIQKLNIVGLLAVEMFLTKSGEILINESAPRPHNSGHHTIEACVTSQYEQLLRCILNLPLGSTKIKSPSVLWNILGAEGFSGEAKVIGFEEALKIEGAYFHFYGKKTTQPFRKMGHCTLLNKNSEKSLDQVFKLKNILRVVSE